MIKRGDKGGDVVAWQNILATQGYQIQVDGVFGPETEVSTKDYQRRLEVPADGIVGDGTLAAHASLFPNIPFAHESVMPEQNVVGSGAKQWIMYGLIGAAAVWLLSRE